MCNKDIKGGRNIDFEMFHYVHPAGFGHIQQDIHIFNIMSNWCIVINLCI